MAMESFQCARHSLGYMSTIGPGKIFNIEVLRRLENTILRFVFANTVFHKGMILLIR